MKKLGVVLTCFFCVMLGWGIYFFVNDEDEKLENEEIVNEEKIVLNEYVLTNSEVDVYNLNNGKYKKSGIIGSDEFLHLSEEVDGYYKIEDITGDYYVKSNNLVNTEEMVTYDDRYKNYIVFNKNIVTNGETNLYDNDGKLVYTFSESMTFPIIIEESDRYGIEFGNRLLYVKSETGKVVENHNTDIENIKGVAVLNYHFFYDDGIAGEKNKCNQIICMSKSLFKKHLDYIKDNDFFSLTMEELEMYIDGKIRLPKSVVITIDDGWMSDLGIQMLTENQLNGTLFVVTSWYDPHRTDYVELHSHSHNMHNTGDCPRGQGGGIQCLAEEFILNDLKTSSEKLGGSKYFCYPFYEYNDYSISMLKKAGYTMAFAGQSYSGSNNLVKVGSDKYRLPRYVMYSYTTVETLSNYLNS